jgi:hypothetical protein
MLENIHQATEWLETTLREDPKEERSLLAAVSTLAERSQLAALLGSLLADQQSTAAAADQSYAHPLGFDRFVLAMSRELDVELRLHVWWPGNHEILEDVHNHQFPFASAVIDGILDMEALERASDGVLMQEYALTSGGAVATSRFRHVGSAILTCTLRSCMPAETVYYMSARALHRITGTNDGLTATLLLRGPVVRSGTTVFSNQTTRQRASIVRPTMTPRSFAEGVAAYLETLDAGVVHTLASRRLSTTP